VTGAKLAATVSKGRKVLLSPHHACTPQRRPAKAMIPNTTLTHQGDFNRMSLNDSLRRFMFELVNSGFVITRPMSQPGSDGREKLAPDL